MAIITQFVIELMERNTSRKILINGAAHCGHSSFCSSSVRSLTAVARPVRPLIAPRPKHPPRLVDMASRFAKQSGLLMNNAINIVGTHRVDTVKCGTFTVVFAGVYGHRQDCHVRISYRSRRKGSTSHCGGSGASFHRKHGRNSDSG